LVQPKWNATGPPRRAPGEVVNRFNHQGLMEETAEALHENYEELQHLSTAGGNSSAAGFSTVSAVTDAGAATRVSRVTTSPSTRCHPNQERRNELRNADMFTCVAAAARDTRTPCPTQPPPNVVVTTAVLTCCTCTHASRRILHLSSAGISTTLPRPAYRTGCPTPATPCTAPPTTTGA
jgi:hypothetical protein